MARSIASWSPPDFEGVARARVFGRIAPDARALSVLIATPFILIQWNLKRLLAYSSIEHVGIMAVGVGLAAEAGVFGALLHMTYHSLAKPVAFFSAGTLAQLHSSSDFKRIGNGTFTRAPVASALFVLAALMITGSPPFGLFFSEMTILRPDSSVSHAHGDVGVPRGADRAVLRLLVSGRAHSCSARRAIPPIAESRRRNVSTRHGEPRPSPRRWPWCRRSICLRALMSLIRAAADVVWRGYDPVARRYRRRSKRRPASSSPPVGDLTMAVDPQRCPAWRIARPTASARG